MSDELDLDFSILAQNGFFLQYLEKFLNTATKKNRKAVIDSVCGRFLDKRKELTKKSARELNKFLDLLFEGNRKTWIKFLFSLEDRLYFDSFKMFSPFKNKVFFAIRYGYGFATLRGGVESFIASIIRNQGMGVYEGDDYTIILNQIDTKKAKVIWMGGKHPPK